MNYSEAHYAQHLIAAKIRSYQANLTLIRNQLSRSRVLNRPMDQSNDQKLEINQADLETQLQIQKDALTKLTFLNMALDKISNTSRIIPYLIYDRFTTISFEDLFKQLIPLFHSQKVKSFEAKELKVQIENTIELA